MPLSQRQWIFLGVRVFVTLLIFATLMRLQGVGMMGGLLLCGILGVMWGGTLAGLFAEMVHDAFSPSAESCNIYREYSIAEARVKQGLFREAIAEFEKYKLEDPEGLTPYLRIADLLEDKFQDYPAAIAQLRSALPLAHSPKTFSLVQFRLADLLARANDDPRAALECLHEVQRKHPGTPQAAKAEERARYLLETLGGESAPSRDS